MKSTRALRDALSNLSESKGSLRKMRGRGHADIGEIFLAEMRNRRARLARLLRLVHQELRRVGGAAAPCYHDSSKARRRAVRARRAAR
jgi:hypothetical protein